MILANHVLKLIEEKLPALLVDDRVFGSVVIEATTLRTLGKSDDVLVLSADFKGGSFTTDAPIWLDESPSIGTDRNRSPDGFIAYSFFNAEWPRSKPDAGKSWTDPKITSKAIKEILATLQDTSA